jgi:hypothetical protein
VGFSILRSCLFPEKHASIFARHREDVNRVGRHYKPF